VARPRPPAARRYVFAARLGTPGQYVLLSEWETRDAMDAYHRSVHFAR
jgi:quinol monooxygenase YgiN